MKYVTIAESSDDDVTAMIKCATGKKAILGFCDNENVHITLSFNDEDKSLSIFHDALSTAFPAIKFRQNGRIYLSSVNSFGSEQLAKEQGYVSGDIWQLNEDGIVRVIR